MATRRRRVSPNHRDSFRKEARSASISLARDEMELSNARNILHLQRSGQSHTKELSNAYNKRKAALIDYVQLNFKRKECIRFVPKKDPKRKPGDPIMCMCGGAPERHINGTSGVMEFFRKGPTRVEKELSEMEGKPDWKRDRDITQLTTNAFGKIEFINEGLGGQKPSKYIRISNTTPAEQVLDFMVKHWNMLEPNHANLVITIIGGAKNFKLDGKKKEVFNQGLINAALTTSAWIITSGCNMGIMKAVGEAIQEGQSYTWDRGGMRHRLRCIGIAPWGYIERKEAVVSEDGFGCWNATYKVNNVIRHGQPVSLNPNHTHFILVDDGERGRYGGTADFRASLEHLISKPRSTGEGKFRGIPVVLVVVEGGFDALSDIHQSLTQKIPIVVCEGTGRAADIIAYAYKHTITTRKGDRVLNDKHRMILEDKLRAAYGKTWSQSGDEQKEVNKFMSIITECCQNEKLITVFNMYKHDEDLDLAILSALLKGQGATEIVQLREQLKLALTWGRSDVAEEKIFTDSVTWPTGFLDDIMTQALIENKVSFVRLLLQNGVVMKEYLSVPRLRKLYNSVPKQSHLHKLLEKAAKRSIFLLCDVNKLLEKLGMKHHHRIYLMDDDFTIVMRDEMAYNGEEMYFPQPFRELFLWAVLMNRQDMAIFIWEHGDQAIPSAINASRIFASLADSVAHYESDQRALYNANSKEFEKMAVRILETCHNAEPEKAAMLIERRYPTWGDMNCLEMAAAAGDKEFLSTVCCQNLMDLMWKRGIASSWPKIFTGLLFPFIILFAVRFTLDNESNPRDRLSARQKIWTFYRAPCTKFAANLFMYLIFLIVYSYFILFEYRRDPSTMEIIVIVWMMSFSTELLRSMFWSSTADTIGQRLKDWWHFNIFNRLDLVILSFSLLAIILRFWPNYGYINAGFITYAFNAVFLYVRILRDFSASPDLGPILVMIIKMFQKLMMYIMILLVFLLAYGVSTNALQYPYRESADWSVLVSLFYYPYWQIYGELYLEELEGRTDECLSPNENGTIGIMYDGSPCPQFNWLVPALTAAYLLIGNILLLNLLIAIFNNVFEEIEVNSIQIWKYGMYFLVIDYDNKPGLAPPFIVFEHIFLFIKWILRKTCMKKKQHEPQFTEYEIELLQIFEKEMLRAFIRHRQLEERGTPDSYIFSIQNRVDEMHKLLEDERLMEQQHYEAEQNKRVLFGAVGNRHLAGHAAHPPPSRPGSRWPTLARIRELKLDTDSMKQNSETMSDFHYHSETTRPGTPDFTARSDHSYEGNISMASNQFADNKELVIKKLNDLTDPPEKGTVDPKNTAELSDYSQIQPPDAKPEPKLPPLPSLPPQRTKSKKKKRKQKQLEEYTAELQRRESREQYETLENESSDSEVEKKNRESGRSRRGQFSETKEMNIQPVSSDRIGDLEQRIIRLEENTERSLYNIEALLRSVVFSRNIGSAPSVPPPRYRDYQPLA